MSIVAMGPTRAAGEPAGPPLAVTAVAIRDAQVTAAGAGTSTLRFVISREAATHDATRDSVRLIVETASGGHNPATAGKDYVPIPPGTEVLLQPDQKGTVVDVTVMGGSAHGSDKTLLLRVTDARAFHPQARLTHASSRFPARAKFPNAIALADFNSDGAVDVATGNDLSLDVSILLNRGDGTFGEAVNHAITVTPQLWNVLVAAGDLTGDGTADIVTAGFSDSALQLFAGDGTGRFADPVSIALDGSFHPTALALGDANRDRHLDVVMSMGAAKQVLVLLGKGDGAFAAPQRFDTGAPPSVLALADINGDRDLDIIAANDNAGGSDVSVLFGDGTGRFDRLTHFPIGAAATPRAIAVADVIGTRDPDIVTANSTSRSAGSVSVFEGDGTGTFKMPIHFALEGPVGGLAVAEIAGTAHADVIVSLPVHNAVAVLAADGRGGFGDRHRLPTPVGPSAIGVADVTGDGKPDAVVVDSAGISIHPAREDGNIGFGGRARAGRYPHSIVAVDLDHNGHADVATANAQSNDVSVFLNSGEGGLAEAVPYAVGAAPTSISSADLDNDSSPDLVAATGATVSVLLGDRAGRFGGAIQYRIGNGSQTAFAIAVADLNGDGNVDVATANSNTSAEGISVLLGDGSGRFGEPAMLPLGSDPTLRHDPRAITLADVTGDGNVDIVTANLGSSNLSLLAGDGRGNFAAPAYVRAGAGPVAVVSADVSGDGRPDLIALNHTAQTVSVLAGDGAGAFAPAVHFAVAELPDGPCEDGVCPWAWGLAVADITGDGHLDVITANTDSDNVSVLANDGSGGFASATLFATGARPGSVAVADVTGDDNLDVITANRRNDDIAVLCNELSRVELLDGEAVGTIRYWGRGRSRAVGR